HGQDADVPRPTAPVARAQRTRTRPSAGLGGDEGMSPSDPHRNVWELLPWYVNGTLGGQDLAAVSAHLPDCPTCQEEVSRCQVLAAVVRAEAADAPAPCIDRVLASIDAIEATRVSRGSWRERLSLSFGGLRDLLRGTPGPMRWTVAVQAALVVL